MIPPPKLYSFSPRPASLERPLGESERAHLHYSAANRRRSGGVGDVDGSDGEAVRRRAVRDQISAGDIYFLRCRRRNL